jgi:hypothetical protein
VTVGVVRETPEDVKEGLNRNVTERERHEVVLGPLPAEMLEALGRLTVGFQAMEAGLAHMIWRVADIGGETATIVTSGLPIKALHGKVCSLLKHHWAEVWRDRAKRLLDRVDRLTDERNHLVHSLWYAVESPTEALRYRATAHAGSPRYSPPSRASS